MFLVGEISCVLYNYQLSTINCQLIVDKLSYHFQDPQRGDIVVFSAPAQALAVCGLPPSFSDPFVKGALGLPGDRVEVKSGQIYINGQLLQESYPAKSPNYRKLTNYG
ncbi:MAG: signal peptidase I [Microcoleus sp. CSU_2_2]|nr:signal peptidase I [Microcoleus sp. CSU_2_2]